MAKYRRRRELYGIIHEDYIDGSKNGRFNRIYVILVARINRKIRKYDQLSFHTWK